jgi:hypothetical protein
MTPRRCQSCRGPRHPRPLQTSERPPLTCRSLPTPRGLVEFYFWWTVVERVGPVAIRSAPPSTADITGAVRCDFCGDSSGRVVGAAAPPPRPARRPPAQLRRPPRHLPLRRMRRAETAHRSATDQTPDSDRVTRSCTAASPRSRGSAAEYSAVLDTPGPCHGIAELHDDPDIPVVFDARNCVLQVVPVCVSCRSGAISMR